MSDYLWDRSGRPDPDVAALEEALSELRFDRPAPVIRRKPPRWWLALAAVALVAVIVLVWDRDELVTIRSELPAPSVVIATEGWTIARLSGTPTCDGDPIEDQTRLQVGGWLMTDDGSTARLDVADIGTVEVAPRSRLRLVESGRARHRLELERGSIHASVAAPPRIFVVDTPSVKAVDLGCEYTLSVAEDGGTVLEVTSGWVALEADGVSMYVPIGTRAHARGGRVGIPYVNDAPAAVVDALRRVEEGGSVEALLKVARRADEVSLWHVLRRADAREPVYRRMLELGARPSSDEAAVLRGDAAALLDWGKTLGLVPDGEGQMEKAPVWE